MTGDCDHEEANFCSCGPAPLQWPGLLEVGTEAEKEIEELRVLTHEERVVDNLRKSDY